MKIYYLKHNEIDKPLWDRIIGTSVNSLPYAYSWYLDVVSPGWEALVTDDYQFVMPLPLKKKYGIKYLIQPRWIQQLGIFSCNTISCEIVKRFIQNIPYLIYDFNINYGNDIKTNNKRINYIIPQSESIEQIRKKYNHNTRRNITKASKSGLTIADVSIPQFVSLWQNENTDKNQDLQSLLEPLVVAASESDKARLFGVFKHDTLVAALFAVVSNNRFIYLVPVSNRQGKEYRAMFMLVDYILENICIPQNLIFDCEGSMIPGVASFYKGFGASEQNYSRISRFHPAKLISIIRHH